MMEETRTSKPTVLRQMVREEDRYWAATVPGYLGGKALLVFHSPEHAELYRAGVGERYEHLEPSVVSLLEIDAMLEDLELNALVLAEPHREEVGTEWDTTLVPLEESL
jgi:hypothetical protein